MVRAAALILALAAPALAQTTDTECRQIGNQTHCESRRTTDIWRQHQQPVVDPGEDEAQELENKKMKLAIEAAELPKRVGRLIAAGKCDRAQSLALEGGDLDLAEKARAYCATK
jgi:hypothetical protein